MLRYQVDSKDSLWTWIENDLLPSLYNTTWYNGQLFEYKEGFISNKKAFMLGMPRLRQLRLKKSKLGFYLQSCQKLLGHEICSKPATQTYKHYL